MVGASRFERSDHAEIGTPWGATFLLCTGVEMKPLADMEQALGSASSLVAVPVSASEIAA